jgi:protein transport protein SEC31
VQMWDLRNARAPERSLAGHSRGILSMAWCLKDSDLLISSGKDNRTIVFSAGSGTMLGDLNGIYKSNLSK